MTAGTGVPLDWAIAGNAHMARSPAIAVAFIALFILLSFNDGRTRCRHLSQTCCSIYGSSLRAKDRFGEGAMPAQNWLLDAFELLLLVGCLPDGTTSTSVEVFGND
ncbi:hypothetical protein FJ970_25505 [Mesorhizobium sp. B2-1-8]|uniref:hypothetical protein n=1 Tax=Mesorhizobium sp. B2-1-8 TaxID=2589967 RepID=UPI00112922EE|nr:hypothetical protein [Mesorhizobium sp. B2-1-8]UCI18397.1 hypothetical protein FJ970_25505 [Mesorhizobium sp. B2-1-8]